MEEILFRCFAVKDNIFLFEDVNIYSAEFPDYISMMLMNGIDNYQISFWIGGYDKNGKRIYLNDIIKYKESFYQITYECPEFLCEHISGELHEEIDPDEIEVTGNIYARPEVQPAIAI